MGVFTLHVAENERRKARLACIGKCSVSELNHRDLRFGYREPAQQARAEGEPRCCVVDLAFFFGGRCERNADCYRSERAGRITDPNAPWPAECPPARFGTRFGVVFHQPLLDELSCRTFLNHRTRARGSINARCAVRREEISRIFAVLRTAKKKPINFRAQARIGGEGGLQAQTPGFCEQNPGFCAARAAIERHLKRLSRFGGKNPAVF